MRVTRRFSVLLALGLLAVVVVGVTPAAAQQTPVLPQSVSELIRLREDVYAFRYLNHVSLFVPTAEGVLVVDPIGGGGNPQAPAVLEEAIASVSNQPVRWLLYSHWGADHGRGGAVFADTATFLSHANAKPKIEAANQPDSPVPSVTFAEMMTLELGGKTFELHWAGLSPEDDYFVFYYPAQKLLMTVDLAQVRGLPFGELPQASPERWVQFLDHLDQSFDFDMYLSGHGPADNVFGTRQDFRDHRQYFQDLMAAVQDARAAGYEDNSPEMVISVQAALEPAYGSWANFNARLAGNVRGVLRWWNM